MLEELKIASGKRPLNYEKESEYLSKLIEFREHKHELGIINLEDSDDVFTKDLYLKIHERFGINKEDALLIANYNEEGIGKLFEILGKLIDSIIDFISNIFGGSSDDDKDYYGKAKEKIEKNNINISDFKGKDDKEKATLLCRVGKTIESMGMNIYDTHKIAIDMIEDVKVINKKKSNSKKGTLSKTLLTLIPKEKEEVQEFLKDLNPKTYYDPIGWRVDDNALNIIIIRRDYVNNRIAYSNIFSVKVKDLTTVEVNDGDIKEYLLKFIINNAKKKNIKELTKKLKVIRKLLKANSAEMNILKIYNESKVHIKIGKIMSAYNKILLAVPKYIKSDKTYHNVSKKLLKNYIINENDKQHNTESFDINLEGIVETPEEKEMLLNIFNLEEDNIKPEAYNKIWGYLKSIAWIDVKTAVDTKLRARLVHDKIGNRSTPLRLNTELAKLHFVWMLSKEYGLNLTEIMSDYTLVCNALSGYIGGDPKSIAKTQYSSSLDTLFDKKELEKISNYNSKAGTYNGSNALLYMSLVNFNVNILDSKHGRMSYVPKITVMVQVVDSASGVLLTTQILNKKLRKNIITRETTDMIVNKILIYLKNDLFTNKKVAGFLKATSNIEKAVNGIKGSLLDDPITAAYMKEGKEISISKIAGNIRTGVTAMIGMTKNIVEFNRIKVYFLNEVIRKTLNQKD